MLKFKNYILQFINEESPYGDVAKELKAHPSRCVPVFMRNHQTIDFLLETHQWEDSAIPVFEDLIDKYEKEVMLPAAGNYFYYYEDKLNFTKEQKYVVWRRKHLESMS